MNLGEVLIMEKHNHSEQGGPGFLVPALTILNLGQGQRHVCYLDCLEGSKDVLGWGQVPSGAQIPENPQDQPCITYLILASLSDRLS